MSNKPIFINELKMNFSLKVDQSAKYADIRFDNSRNCFCGIYDPLQLFSKFHSRKAYFLDNFKIAKVTTVIKADEQNDLVNCIPTSMFPVSTKCLKKIV